jgi:hypothetical protein
MKKTHTKMVSAIGAIHSFLWKKMLPTMSSMNSTIISTPFCSAPGIPAVARRAARPNNQTNSTPSAIAHTIESTLIAQKPISRACSEFAAKPQLPSGMRP